MVISEERLSYCGSKDKGILQEMEDQVGDFLDLQRLEAVGVL